MRTRWRVGQGAGYQRSSWNNTTKTWINPFAQPGHVNSLEYMQDSLHDVKRLGKSLNDIGGSLDQTTIKTTLSDWTPARSYCSTRGTNDVFIPLVGNAGGGDAARALHALQALRTAHGGFYGSGVTRPLVEGAIVDRVTSHLSLSDMDVLGTDLVNAVRPTNPAVDLATGVAELLAERKFFSPTPSGSASGDYLNYQLGIAPTVSLGRQFREAQRNADVILEQYERDAGRLVRRRYQLPEVTDVQQGTSGLWTRWGVPHDTDQGFTYDLQGGWTWTFSKSHKRWFSGAFTYPPPAPGWMRHLAELERLYGVIPGIDTAWELVPFSFVADYFSNMGNVLSNLNSFVMDGLVMPYGYVMETHKSTWQYFGTYSYRETPTGATMSKTLAFTIEVENRRRRAATPFGFGFNSELTARQGSILVALGINFLR